MLFTTAASRATERDQRISQQRLRHHVAALATRLGALSALTGMLNSWLAATHTKQPELHALMGELSRELVRITDDVQAISRSRSL